MPGLKLVEVDREILATALSLMRKYNLDPRDSIHATSAFKEGAEVIVSLDKHLDNKGSQAQGYFRAFQVRQSAKCPFIIL